MPLSLLIYCVCMNECLCVLNFKETIKNKARRKRIEKRKKSGKNQDKSAKKEIKKERMSSHFLWDRYK